MVYLLPAPHRNTHCKEYQQWQTSPTPNCNSFLQMDFHKPRLHDAPTSPARHSEEESKNSMHSMRTSVTQLSIKTPKRMRTYGNCLSGGGNASAHCRPKQISIRR